MAELNSDERMGQQELDYIRQLMNLGQGYQQINQNGPFGSTNWTTNADGTRTLNQSVDPRILQNYYNTLDQQQSARNLYGRTTDQLDQRLGEHGYDVNDAGGPARVGSVAPTSQMTGFDRSGFLGIPGADDFGGSRDKAEDAIYGRYKTRLDDRFGQQESSLETKLRNQGFTPGTEGYDAAKKNFDTGRNDAYSSAAQDAVAGGSSEATRLLSDALRIRGQQGEEGVQDVGMYNDAAGRNFDQRLQAGGFQNQSRGGNLAEYASNFMIPAQLQSGAAAQITGNTQMPNMNNGTFSPMQPNSPSFSSMSQAGANTNLANQANTRQNVNTYANLAGTVFGSLFGS